MNKGHITLGMGGVVATSAALCLGLNSPKVDANISSLEKLPLIQNKIEQVIDCTSSIKDGKDDDFIFLRSNKAVVAMYDGAVSISDLRTTLILNSSAKTLSFHHDSGNDFALSGTSLVGKLTSEGVKNILSDDISYNYYNSDPFKIFDEDPLMEVNIGLDTIIGNICPQNSHLEK